MNRYFSFLICDHGERVNIYYNGIPIGSIINGEFKIHQFVNSDGSLRELMIEDLPQPCPFKNRDELVESITSVLSKVQIKNRTPQKP